MGTQALDNRQKPEAQAEMVGSGPASAHSLHFVTPVELRKACEAYSGALNLPEAERMVHAITAFLEVRVGAGVISKQGPGTDRETFYSSGTRDRLVARVLAVVPPAGWHPADRRSFAERTVEAAYLAGILADATPAPPVRALRGAAGEAGRRVGAQT